MKLGLHALHGGGNISVVELAELARHAERAGFESLWVGDHIALPEDAGDHENLPPEIGDVGSSPLRHQIVLCQSRFGM